LTINRATIPGAILGALSTNLIPRTIFNVGFGVLMVAAGIYLFFCREKTTKPSAAEAERHCVRTVTEKNGTTHTFSYDLGLGIKWSLLVGYLSSLLGIGGGIIHVPILVRLLNFPVHVATATSHFVLAIMALTGTIVHIATGTFSGSAVDRTLALAVGVTVGAQLGAKLSDRIHGKWIIRSLAAALALAGLRILMLAR
jgi:uncharacterized protein